jgi:glycerol-3-phosphate O-acyltransferase
MDLATPRSGAAEPVVSPVPEAALAETPGTDALGAVDTTGVPATASAMMEEFGGIAGAFAERFFGEFHFEDAEIARLEHLEQRGAVAYVMRYSSRLDYLLFNWLFLRSGIRRSVFANGVTLTYHRPLREGLRLMWQSARLRLRGGRAAVHERDLAAAREAVKRGQSLFLFLRTGQLSSRLQPKSRAVAKAVKEIDYLREIVDASLASEVNVSLVPLALFWRKGGKQQRRFLNVLYGSPDRPSTTWKLLSFLFSYRNLAVRVGGALDLRGLIDAQRPRAVDRAVRQVRRSVLIYLRREEKPILGAALRSRARIEEQILRDPEVRSAIRSVAQGQRATLERVETRARREVRRIAAHPSPTVMAILVLIVDWMFRKIFPKIDVRGMDRIVEAAKLHPLVLIPAHRSHFDYLILSWLFYERHLAPPLVAAGMNLVFFPLGSLFRRAGAFFLRRNFDADALYTAVLRSYIKLLIKDGATQEFFIEGERSRTGKTLQPRSGLLGMILDAFARGARRDLYVVPVGLSYELLVEESSMVAERSGARKVPESLMSLVRAASVLRRRAGPVTIQFGEPISLATVVHTETKPPEDLDALAEGVPHAGELHDLSRRLGVEICRRINGLVAADGTAVASAALLGENVRACPVARFRERVMIVAELLHRAELPWSDGLSRMIEQGRPMSAASYLIQRGRVQHRDGHRHALLVVPDRSREVLALYREKLLPALCFSALMATALLHDARAERGRSAKELIDVGMDALRLLRLELFPPDRSVSAERFETVLGYFAERGWVRDEAQVLFATSEGREWLPFLALQLRPMLQAYQSVFQALGSQDGPLTRGALLASAQDVLEEQLLLGEAAGSESICHTTFFHALSLLIEEDVIAAEGNPRRDDTLLTPGARHDGLAALVARLARWLPDR